MPRASEDKLHSWLCSIVISSENVGRARNEFCNDWTIFIAYENIVHIGKQMLRLDMPHIKALRDEISVRNWRTNGQAYG